LRLQIAANVAKTASRPSGKATSRGPRVRKKNTDGHATNYMDQGPSLEACGQLCGLETP
jgi:hypothetical protein